MILHLTVSIEISISKVDVSQLNSKPGQSLNPCYSSLLLYWVGRVIKCLPVDGDNDRVHRKGSVVMIVLTPDGTAS